MDRVIKKRKKLNVVIPVIILSIFIILTILKLISQNYLPFYTLKQSQLIYSVVKEVEISKNIQAVGIIEPISRIIIESLENGIITKISGVSGFSIKKGESILKLYNEKLEIEQNQLDELIELKHQQLNIIQNEYNYSKTEHSDILLDMEYHLEKLEVDYEKNNLLYKTGSIPKDTLEKSENEYTYWLRKSGLYMEKLNRYSILQKSKEMMFDIELESLLNKNSILKKRMDRLTIIAPNSGILNLEDFSIGQNIQEQQYLGTIDRQDNFKLTAYIDEFYISDIQIGDIAVFKLKGSMSKTYKAQINFISPVVSGSRIRLKFVLITALPDSIRSGQSLNMKILQSEPEIKSVIEIGGFLKESGGNWVYRVENEGAVKVPITTGIKNSEYIEVLSGLNIGDKVIISSYKKFKDYEKLKIEGIK